MIKSYFKLGLRNIWKHKSSSAINVLSLSVGLASCALVFLFWQHELSFDKGFDDAGNIYRVTSDFGGGSSAPTVSMPYAKYLKQEIPEIKQVTRMDPTNGATIVQAISAGTSTPIAEDSGYWVDPEFFDVLSFHFLQGDRSHAFSAPNTMVLSQTLAQKLFGQAYPIGKTLRAAGAVYTITGVFKEDFLNHIHADFFASNNSDKIRDKMAINDNWVVNDNFYTYIKLRPNASVPHVIAELNAYLQKHGGADMKKYNDHIINSLQALKDIHLHSSQYQDYLAYKQGNIRYLYLMASIALVILLLGCINYMNLSTAQAISRAREVGVRRVIGAGKAAIRYQVLVETLVIGFCALIIAVALALLFLPVFNGLTGQNLSFLAPENRSLILWLLLVTCITGLAAGVYPAFYLSAFKPVKVLKGRVSDNVRMFSIRKVLIVSQFVISTCLLFATMVISDQLHYMLNSKTGFDKDQQLVLNLGGEQSQQNARALINELNKNANFKSVTLASAPLISGDMNLYPQGKTINDKQIVFMDFADENYLKTLGLQLVAGSNLAPQVFTNTNMQEDMEVHDFGKQIILNQEAVKLLGLDVNTAVGKRVSHLHNGIVYNYKVVGVIKDYHFFSLHTTIGPCGIMVTSPLRCSNIIAKIATSHAQAAVDHASASWKKLNPDTPFSYGFLNDIFQSDYDQDRRAQQVVETFACVAIFISCLGLLGLITYTVSQKVREISVRKVIGASVGNIVLLFTKQYFKLIIIANLIALPLAWYIMNNWLRDYPYRVHIGWPEFVISMITGIAVVFATIAFKTIRAAMANPVDGLRAE